MATAHGPRPSRQPKPRCTGAIFSKRGMRIHLWCERVGSQDMRQIHRPTIPARHSLFLRRSPSPYVCIGDVEHGCADEAQRPGGGTRLLRSRQRRGGSFWWILGEFFFNPFLLNILIIIAPGKKNRISPFFTVVAR